MDQTSSRKLLIIVGGGPAPGINSVVAAATREATKHGWKVFGAVDGYKGLLTSGLNALLELDPREVAVVANDGGSLLGTSKVDPTANKESKETLLRFLQNASITDIITIGGEGSLRISHQLFADAAFRVVHVPKTIDNDLPLPGLTSTFGFQTAREAGSQIVRALMADARTTKRYYVAVTQGRDAGHLALGIGLASGASLTLIPELSAPHLEPRKDLLRQVVDCMAGTVLKRRSINKHYGVIVVAEGLSQLILHDPDFDSSNLQRDPHGNVRFSEIDFSGILKRQLRTRLEGWGVQTDIVNHDIGYELRSAPPNAFDREYTIQLGYGAVQFLLQNHSLAMITREWDRLVPIPFSKLVDAKSQVIRTRCVDIHSETYLIARQYMDCVEQADIAESTKFEALAKLTTVPTAELRGYLKSVAEMLQSTNALR